MRNKLLVVLALSSFSVAGACAQKPPAGETDVWILRSAEGPFTVSCPNVVLEVTGTKTFDINLKDWDLYESSEHPGTFASFGNLKFTLSSQRSAGLSWPAGVSLQYVSNTIVSAAETKLHYKYVTTGAVAASFSVIYTAIDTGGTDLFGQVVGKDANAECEQFISF